MRFLNGTSTTTALWEFVPLYKEGDKNFTCTAEHLFNVIRETFANRMVPYKNIVNFGTDGCSLMMGQHNFVSSRFLDLCPGIMICSCICHSLHLCARSTEDLCRNIYSFFKVINCFIQFCRKFK